MTPPAGGGGIGPVESLCAALRDAYERIGRQADAVAARVRLGEVPSLELVTLEESSRETVPLWQALDSRLLQAGKSPLTPAEDAALAETRQVLADSVTRVRAATEGAVRLAQSLGRQLDEGLRNLKGVRAYRRNN